MTSHIEDIKKAFTELCHINGIPTDGALSAEPDRHEHNIIITLDLSKIKNEGLWIDIQTIERKFKNSAAISAKVNWECAEDKNGSYQFPKSFTLTALNSKVSVAAIEAACSFPLNNSQAASNKGPSGKNGAGNDGNGTHALRIRQSRKPAQENNNVPESSVPKDELMDYLKRQPSHSVWIKG